MKKKSKHMQKFDVNTVKEQTEIDIQMLEHMFLFLKPQRFRLFSRHTLHSCLSHILHLHLPIFKQIMNIYLLPLNHPWKVI